jgi:hypothetical protein
MSQRPVSTQPPSQNQRPPSASPQQVQQRPPSASPQQVQQPQQGQQQRPQQGQQPQQVQRPQQVQPSPSPQQGQRPQQVQPSPSPQQAQQPQQVRQQSAMPVRSDTERIMPTKSMDLPIDGTMIYAMQLALKKDKPIILTFWMDSLEKKIVFLHDEAEKETILFKSPEEYTSPLIQKYNNKTDVICETENSLYIIKAGMETKNA